MAKAGSSPRGSYDFDDAPRGTEVQMSAPDPEKAALLAEVAELRALLAQRDEVLSRERTAAVVDAPVATGADYWAVRLKFAPEHVVMARDAANAWEAYRSEMGVLTSDHRPEVVPADREAYHRAQARRHGVKPEEFTLRD